MLSACTPRFTCTPCAIAGGRLSRRCAYSDSVLNDGPSPLLRGSPPRSTNKPAPDGSRPVVMLYGAPLFHVSVIVSAIAIGKPIDPVSVTLCAAMPLDRAQSASRFDRSLAYEKGPSVLSRAWTHS